MTRIAIIAAMPDELKPLVRGWKHERQNGVDLWRFRTVESEWIAACAGAGVDAATRAFAQAEKSGPIDEVLSTGWAGALREEFLPGQANDVSTVIDALTGERFVAACPPNDCCLVTSSRVAGAGEKKRLAATYEAALVDMEAAAVARLAKMRGVPFYCVKGISDGVSDQLPDFNNFISPEGQFQLARFIVFAVLRPWHWPALVRMGENSKKAARNIAQSVLNLLDERRPQATQMATQTNNADPFMNSKIPATMRAVVYRGVNDLRVETVPVPQIGPGELLVKIATCGICGTDLKKIHTGSHSAPRIFGHEMAGTIVQLGEGVSKFRIGERVMVHHHVPCGKCYYCRKQTFAQCPVYKKVGATAGFEPSGGGFSEYIRVMDWIVELGGVVRIPDGVPFEQASFMEPVNTVLKGVTLLNLAADETVLVIGQGPIGIMLAALSRRTGARVLTSDLYPERHAIAAKFGLHEPIHAGTENVVERTLAATEGRGADAVILAVGANALIKTAMDAVRCGGKVMLFAQTQHGEANFDPGAVCMDEKSLIGSYSASAAILDEVAGLVLGGCGNGFDLTQLISHRFSLEEAVHAIEVASNPHANSMKIMIEPVPGAGAR